MAEYSLNDPLTTSIPLVYGGVTLVDREDANTFKSLKWTGKRLDGMTTLYAYCRITENGRRRHLLLYREITKAPKGTHVDHINHDTLDNRRSNLRVCSVSENCMNQKEARSNKSGYKGVCWKKDRSKWASQICVNRRVMCLGYFSDPECAARAYDEAAIMHFGEFALTNVSLGKYKEKK